MSNDEKTVMFAMPNLLTGHLACVGGTMSGRSWELTAGTFTVGRLEDHDMCLSAEPGVSKTHAKIMGQGDHYIIVDAESRNGTLVNGQPVQKAELFDGDEIRICGCLLRFTQVGGRPRRVPVVSAAENGPPTAAFVQPVPMPMASPPPAITGPQFTAPQAAPVPTPLPMSAPMVSAAPMTMAVAAPSTGKILGAWYAAGLAASLLLGGGASAALIATGEDPAVAVATPPAGTAPENPTTTKPTETAPTGTPATDAAPTPPVEATPPAVDAGVAPTDATPTPTPEPPAPPPAPTPAPPAPPPAPVQVAATDPVVEDTPAEPEERPRRRATSTTGTGPFAASVESGGVEVLKSRSGGRVKTTVSDGATVAKGTVIVTFETSADAGEIATLQDRISSLEGVEGDEAKRDLKAAKQKLAALQGSADAAPVVATMDGVVQGLLVSPGTIVRAGEPIGRVVDTSVTPRVRVSVPRSLRPKSGQKVMMNLKSGGSISGTVVAVSGRSVLIDPGSESAENIESVGF